MGSADLDHRRAGMLRRMDAPTGPGRRRFAALRPTWDALVRGGLAEESSGLYRRTSLGEERLRAFDAALAEDELDMLRRVRDCAVGARGHWAVHRLVAAGLAGMDAKSEGTPAITADGLAVLAARRAPGNHDAGAAALTSSM